MQALGLGKSPGGTFRRSLQLALDSIGRRRFKLAAHIKCALGNDTLDVRFARQPNYASRRSRQSTTVRLPLWSSLTGNYRP
jgi:hypothetical protein